MAWKLVYQKWKCPRCNHVEYIRGSSLDEIGTPWCDNEQSEDCFEKEVELEYQGGLDLEVVEKKAKPATAPLAAELNRLRERMSEAASPKPKCGHGKDREPGE